MTKLYISLFILFATIFGAVAETQQELDVRIENANTMRRQAPKASIKPLYEAYLEANSHRYAQQCCKALTYLGWALYNQQYADLALQVFEYANGYSSDDDTQLQDLISLGMGACYSSLESYDKGESLLLESLKQSKANGNKRETMMIYTYLGDLYSNCANDSKARNAFNNSISLAEEVKDSIFESALICNLATFENDVTKAEALYSRSIELCQKVNNKSTECYAYCNLAETYFNHGDYAKALHTLDMANRLLSFLPTNDKIVSYLHDIYGKIYAAQKDYPAAYNHIIIANTQRQTDYTRLAQEREEYTLIIKDIVKQCEVYNLSTQEIRYKNTYWSLIAVIVCILLCIALYIYFHRKTRRQAEHLSRQTGQIQQLKAVKEAQDDEIMVNHRVMNYLYGYYSSRNILLEKISQMIKEAYKMPSAQLNPHLRNINNLIVQSYSKEKENELFADLSNEYKAFTDRLLKRFPDLSKTDIQLAIYYRMGLSTRDIARLLGKQPQTVTMARYRLRKEIDLPEDQDLTQFFNSI
jgi:tetratricopeptide (TPR) repeat protein